MNQNKITFKRLIQRTYGTITEMKEQLGVSHPTALKYARDPLTMTVGTLLKISVHANMSVYEVWDSILESYKEEPKKKKEVSNG